VAIFCGQLWSGSWLIVLWIQLTYEATRVKPENPQPLLSQFKSSSQGHELVGADLRLMIPSRKNRSVPSLSVRWKRSPVPKTKYTDCTRKSYHLYLILSEHLTFITFLAETCVVPVPVQMVSSTKLIGRKCGTPTSRNGVCVRVAFGPVYH
jgi:hypothetical protein